MTEKSLCRCFAVKIGANFISREKDWMHKEIERIFIIQGIIWRRGSQLLGVAAIIPACLVTTLGDS